MYMIIRHMCIQYSRTRCTIYSIDCNLWNLHVFTSVLWHFSVYVTNTKHFQLKILKVSINKISYQVNVIWKISTWTVVSGVLNNLHKPIFWELFKKLDKTFKKSAWKNPQADNIEKFFPRICKPGSRTEIQEMNWEWGRILNSWGHLLIPQGTPERLKGGNERFTILMDLGRESYSPWSDK